MGGVLDKNLLNQALAVADGGWIVELNVDLARHSLSIKVYVSGPNQYHLFIFSDVVSFYFTRGYGDYRYEETGHELDIGLWGISEWTSAGYYPKGVGTVAITAEPGSYESQWVGRYSTNPNFAIEQLVGMLLIEAGQVQVDDQVFEVGFPPIRSNEDEDAKN